MPDPADENDRDDQAAAQAVRGSCHCGAVRFEARADLSAGFRCNCSICTKLGAFVATSEPSSFRLISGEQQLTEYRFGPETLRRYFCGRCGIHCFARGPSSDPGREDVHLQLSVLEGLELNRLPAVYFDGRHDQFEPRSTPWPLRRE